MPLIVSVAALVVTVGVSGVAWWRMQQLQEERDSSAQRVAQLDQSVQAAQKQIADMAAKQAEQVQKVQVAEKTIETQTVQVTAQKEQVDQLVKDRDEARTRLAAVQKSLGDLNDKYGAAVEAEAQTRKMVDSLRDENTRTKEQLQAAMANYKNGMVQLRASMNAIFKDLRPAPLIMAQFARDEAERELNRLSNNPFAGYGTKSSSTYTATKSQKDMLDAARKRLAETTAELNRLESEWVSRREQLLDTLEKAAEFTAAK